ncbi:hypothetical protein P280DRAFT_465399 [Massarina eburnea CBS 473.64]|uniref:Uncharacterized protein n=1 Tax=Massarina eburnea CBS 473.64 TaxID=1395130 RepID=A0A6A6SCM7_9PLEO|nr:hypothetical protein P280DRAFT_465399 [Massarina eburnea CBS 473.64]
MAPTWPASPVRAELLLKLPRELRDGIYDHVLKQSGEVPLKASYLDGIPPLFWKDATLLAEALQNFYAVNTFVLSLETDAFKGLAKPWGPYPEAKTHIRHLVITCGERYSIKSAAEYEETAWCSHDRRRWSQLLELPNLRSLTVNLQKMHETSLFTMDFGPILYALRESRPGINITFNISFDEKLQSVFDDPWWSQFNHSPQPVNQQFAAFNAPPDRYKEMGFIDISELVAAPSEEDYRYVAEFLPRKKMPAVPRAAEGLMSETAANRRVLGKYYVVKEPGLLRVLMEDQYRVYLKCEKEREARA